MNTEFCSSKKSSAQADPGDYLPVMKEGFLNLPFLPRISPGSPPQHGLTGRIAHQQKNGPGF